MATLPSPDPERYSDLHLTRRPREGGEQGADAKADNVPSKIGDLDAERCLWLQRTLRSIRENPRSYPMQPEFWWARPRQVFPYFGAVSLEQRHFYERQLSCDPGMVRTFFEIKCQLKIRWWHDAAKTIERCLYEWPATWLALCPHLVVESTYAGRLCFWSADGEGLGYAESTFAQYELFVRLIIPRQTMESCWGDMQFFEGYRQGRLDRAWVAADVKDEAAD